MFGRSLHYNSSTPLREIEIDQTYQAEPFRPTEIIRDFHEWPRFGLSNQISDLASGSNDQQKDYVVGIVCGSLIILGLAVIWLLILILLKCCGRRVGCASGRPRPPKRPVPQGRSEEGFEMELGASAREVEEGPIKVDNATQADYEAAMEQYRRQTKRHDRTMLVTRIIFMLSGVCAIVASILFFVKGAGDLLNSIGSVQDGLGHANAALTKGIDVTDLYAKAQAAVNEQRASFADVAVFCNISIADNPTATNLLDLVNRMAEIADQLITLTTQFAEEAVTLGEDMRAGREIIDDINHSLESIKPWFGLSIAFSAILDIIVISLMISVAVIWAGKTSKVRCVHSFMRCMRNVLIIPVMLIFMFLSWLFASAFAIAAVCGADFCIDCDSHILAFLDEYADEFSDDSLVLEFVKYYVSACDARYEPIAIPDLLPIGIYDTVNATHNLLEYISNSETPESLEQICRNEEADGIPQLADVMHSQLHALWGALRGLVGVLQCSTMNPIYTSIVHSGVCTDGVSGLGWIFATQLMIAVCCMVMITLRASWFEVEKDELEERGGQAEESDEELLPPKDIKEPASSKDEAVEDAEKDGQAEESDEELPPPKDIKEPASSKDEAVEDAEKDGFVRDEQRSA